MQVITMYMYSSLEYFSAFTKSYRYNSGASKYTKTTEEHRRETGPYIESD